MSNASFPPKSLDHAINLNGNEGNDIYKIFSDFGGSKTKITVQEMPSQGVDTLILSGKGWTKVKPSTDLTSICLQSASGAIVSLPNQNNNIDNFFFDANGKSLLLGALTSLPEGSILA